MSEQKQPNTAAWGAVFAVAVGVAALITVEFLPISLLTPMAEGLSISEGVAGQSISATALIAIFSSLFVTPLTRGIDRRIVVLGFSVLLTLSSIIVALAPNFAWLVIGRMLLGLALGGFWALAASLAMRLVPGKDIPKALSIIFGGVSVSMVVAAPLGSYLGAVIGWRGVFLAASAFGVICFLWQAIALPSMPDRSRSNVSAIFSLAARSDVRVPMLAIFTVFRGNFALFTYLRPFLEQVSHFDVAALSLILLGFGIANFIGTTFSSLPLKYSLHGTLAIVPMVMGVNAVLMAVFGTHQVAIAMLILLHGAGSGLVPVAWSTWVTRALGDEAEAAGGLQVAVIQLANMAGAMAGGFAFDSISQFAPMVLGGMLLTLTFLLVGFGMTRRDRKGAVNA
ncbi:MFS transporter [uncultured Cohaesibacter sp.]|uniref:MFS transporter n=1 Tax=uncultured Cohaesibacter sp. TaxID=1002546 RepID=UPI00292CF1DA|nr:MFS transporter [uncultured Cohaesibacter sp.]